MTNQFKELSHFLISSNAAFKPGKLDNSIISLNDPATKVMTDLHSVIIRTISPTNTIDKANMTMIAFGVRLLFVLDQFDNLLGLITTTDILGEKPIQYLTEHGGSRDEIIVQEIMTQKKQLDVLHMKDVEKACVGDIIETIRHINRQHLLVVEHQKNTHADIIRGIFSTSHINNRCQRKIEFSSRATSFSELKLAITSNEY